jgi:undecaprenyl-phosphate 4-deoxy-4-formamido-L-arabinose transferase
VFIHGLIQMPTPITSLSVVIPVYNGEAALPELTRRLEFVLRRYQPKAEVIFVNDGSGDGSWGAIAELARAHEWVRGLDLLRNYGQHNALLCGIRAARYDVVVTMDDDLQHPPEEIPRMLARLSEGFDVVYGTPVGERHELWRTLASRVTKAALRSVMGAETARHISPFRAFRAQLRDAFADFRGQFVNVDVLLTWGSGRFSYVPVRHEPRAAGRTNYTFGKLVRHALNMVTGFSVLPLQVASLVGFAFTLVGLLVLAFVVGRYFLEGGSVPGFPFLASVIAIFSGAQLFALGIIGEYLARMHFRMMERPAYAVRESAGRRESADESLNRATM